MERQRFARGIKEEFSGISRRGKPRRTLPARNQMRHRGRRTIVATALQHVLELRYTKGVFRHGDFHKDTAGKIMRLMDALEDLDDVTSTHVNFDIPEELLG